MLRQRKPRIRDEKHLKFIRSLFCAICGREGVDAAHLRAGSLEYEKEMTGMGRKPDDKFVTPLCRKCHTEQHSMKEIEFWQKNGIADPFKLCLELYENTDDYDTCVAIIKKRRGLL